MYIVIAPQFNFVDYALITDDGEVIYSDHCFISDWPNARMVTKQLQDTFLHKLRTHGKVATKVGIILPFSMLSHDGAKRASSQLLKELASTQLKTSVLLPVVRLFEVVKQQWPHVPHYFLSDTCLSSGIERHEVLPPFDYDTQKNNIYHPLLIHSYGHKANLEKIKKTVPSISLYVGRQVSVALFDGSNIIDASVSYGPYSPLLGFTNPPAFDSSFMVELSEKRKGTDLNNYLFNHSGLCSILERTGTVDEWLAQSGLAPRQDAEDLPIEAIEWTELTMRSFVRSIRHAIGAMITSSPKMPQVIINTSHVPQSSALWELVLKGTLAELPVVYSKTSLLQAAAHDLNNVDD